ncbi:P1 family peptidase [Corynebacterium macclintockiae]|uniref:P1 family peptidase n=1 Tax=Corynebacterium macclintockiae TaxID=2913501 RepID=UPI002550C6D7|nr:P1 family peptidase [Corynebacterium macclintockiae]MDK8890160.1 P1 family peptidase [Corynebacterium macclintockiae]
MSIELFGCQPGPTNSLADVAGIGVGHAVCEDGAGDSGVTMIVAPKSATASVDVRGGGPGTRETDLLAPHNTVQAVHAIGLCGGSAFGLDALTGTMAELESRGIGFPMLGPEHPDKLVPIVPGAVIFDLLLGRWDSRPDAATGAAATAEALDASVGGPGDATGQEALAQGTQNGNVGAGLGASAGVLKGGFGQASAVFPEGTPLAGVTVAVGIVVNPQGAVFDPATGLPWGLAAELNGEFARYGLSDGLVDGESVGAGGVNRLKNKNMLGTKITADMLAPKLNTTIGVVATDAPLTKAQAKRLALAGHDGIARAIRPAHMPMDGDTLFALATGEHGSEVAVNDRGVDDIGMSVLSATAANTVERAIVHAVLAAESALGVPCWRDVVKGEDRG